MTRMIRLAAVVVALGAFAQGAKAQDNTTTSQDASLKATATEYSFEIRPTIGLVIPLSGGDVGWDIGASLRAKPPTWPIGVQLDFIFIDLSSTLFQVTADAVYDFSVGQKSFHPYAIGGLGLYDGTFGLNIGLGADFAVSGSPIGFFAETRFHFVFESNDTATLLPINAGVRIRF